MDVTDGDTDADTDGDKRETVNQRGQVAGKQKIKPKEFTPDDIAKLSDNDRMSEVMDIPYRSVIIDLFTPESRAELINAFLSCGTQPITMAEICDQHPEVTEEVYRENIHILTEKYNIIRDLGEFECGKMYQLNKNNPLTQLMIMGDEIYQNGKSHSWLDSEFVQ